MTLKLRRTLFYGLVFLFIVSGITMILYSRGWRINIGNCENPAAAEATFKEKIKNFLTCEFRIEKTGGIYLETKPRGVLIKIDGEDFPDKSGLLQAGTLIKELLPKSYRVEITKDGYYSWLKNLRVKPEVVTKAQNIVLVPKKFNKESISIPRRRGDQLEAVQSGIGKILLKDSSTGTFYLYDPANPSTTFNVNLNFANLSGDVSIRKIAFHPFDADKLIVESENGLYSIDSRRLTLDAISETKPLVWAAKGSGVYFLLENASSSRINDLFYFNLIVKTQSLVSRIKNQDLSRSAIVRLGVSDSQSSIALLYDSGGLYLLNQTEKGWGKIADKAKDFDFSPDGKKIAFLDKDRKLNILFLDDWPTDSPKKAGDIVRFELRNELNGISWYKDSYHLFIDYPDELRLMEIDDRLPNNSYFILSGIGNNFYYEPNSNFFYFFQDKNLYRIIIQ